MIGMLYLCLNSSFSFLFFEKKAKAVFFNDCFDTSMVLVFAYCG